MTASGPVRVLFLPFNVPGFLELRAAAQRRKHDAKIMAFGHPFYRADWLLSGETDLGPGDLSEWDLLVVNVYHYESYPKIYDSVRASGRRKILWFAGCDLRVPGLYGCERCGCAPNCERKDKIRRAKRIIADLEPVAVFVAADLDAEAEALAETGVPIERFGAIVEPLEFAKTQEFEEIEAPVRIGITDYSEAKGTGIGRLMIGEAVWGGYGGRWKERGYEIIALTGERSGFLRQVAGCDFFGSNFLLRNDIVGHVEAEARMLGVEVLPSLWRRDLRSTVTAMVNQFRSPRTLAQRRKIAEITRRRVDPAEAWGKIEMLIT